MWNRPDPAACTRALLGVALMLLGLHGIFSPAVAATFPPAYIGRVASATSGSPSTTMTLTASRAVAAGDAVLVSVLLSTTLPGGVSMTDAAGNIYTVDLDQADGLGLDRLLLFSSKNVRALGAGATLTIGFPLSASTQISVDEFAGLTGRDETSSAWGSGSTFSSGYTLTNSQPVELLFGIAGTDSGAAPGWAPGWSGLPDVMLRNAHLGVAYKVSSSTGQFAASGSISNTWMAGIATYTVPPPPDSPPTARLSVAPVSSPGLTVTADASGSSDMDATPIASYRFDFGDGTAAATTNAPTATKQHTYAAAGTYTVTLVVTDTGGNRSASATASVTVQSAPPPDNPPSARLTVRTLSTPALSVNADGSGSTDSDATPIAGYQFDFGDGTAAVTTTAPTATKQHTYAAAGTYTVTLIVTDTGGNRSAPATASVTVQSAPPPDSPPTASLTVTHAASPPLTVVADGSGSSDTDATPIASYRFDFGDGTAAATTTAPTATKEHTYAAAGTYTVTLIVTDTGGNRSAPATASVTVQSAPPPDNPPTARLTLTKATGSTFTVNADASGSSDTDATPIASYEFDFGDGSPPVVTAAPSATAQHTYAAPGTYTVTLVVTDTGGKSSTPARASITFTATTTGGPIAVYVGYYDTHHPANIRPKPDPWQGSPNVAFAGKPDDGGSGWDTGAIRVVNLSSSPLTGVYVTADIGSNHYGLWGTYTIQPGASLILAQTSTENFDGSDTNPAGCYGCDPRECVTMVSHTLPVVRVTVGGSTTAYTDDHQVLNTGGFDAAGCPSTGERNDESRTWQQIMPRQNGSAPPSFATAPALDSRVWLARPVPNPSRGDVAVRFSTATRGSVQLGVYDVTGRLVIPCLDRVLEAGEYHLQLNLDRAVPGMYFVQLSTPEGSRQHKLTHVR